MRLVPRFRGAVPPVPLGQLPRAPPGPHGSVASWPAGGLLDPGTSAGRLAPRLFLRIRKWRSGGNPSGWGPEGAGPSRWAAATGCPAACLRRWAAGAREPPSSRRPCGRAPSSRRTACRRPFDWAATDSFKELASTDSPCGESVRLRGPGSWAGRGRREGGGRGCWPLGWGKGRQGCGSNISRAGFSSYSSWSFRRFTRLGGRSSSMDTASSWTSPPPLRAQFPSCFADGEHRLQAAHVDDGNRVFLQRLHVLDHEGVVLGPYLFRRRGVHARARGACGWSFPARRGNPFRARRWPSRTPPWRGKRLHVFRVRALLQRVDQPLHVSIAFCGSPSSRYSSASCAGLPVLGGWSPAPR